MGCERSVTTMTLLRLGYLVDNLGNRAMTLPTKTGLIHTLNGIDESTQLACAKSKQQQNRLPFSFCLLKTNSFSRFTTSPK